MYCYCLKLNIEAKCRAVSKRVYYVKYLQELHELEE